MYKIGGFKERLRNEILLQEFEGRRCGSRHLLFVCLEIHLKTLKGYKMDRGGLELMFVTFAEFVMFALEAVAWLSSLFVSFGDASRRLNALDAYMAWRPSLKVLQSQTLSRSRVNGQLNRTREYADQSLMLPSCCLFSPMEQGMPNSP